MEAIVPAFLFALLAQLTDRPAALTALLADRYGRPLTVALAAGLGHAAGNGVAAFAGAAMTPMLNPNAQALLLAIALVFGGVDGIRRMKSPRRIESWRMGMLFTPLAGVLVLSAGDRTQFFTLALSARGLPGYAAAGAALGTFAVAVVAAVLGERGWQQVQLRRVRIATSVIFLLAGIYIGLGALRLL